MKYELDMKRRESPPAKPSIEESIKLEIKDRPPYLRNVFLGSDDTLSVIITAYFIERQVVGLVAVLKRLNEPLAGLLQTLLGFSCLITNKVLSTKEGSIHLCKRS